MNDAFVYGDFLLCDTTESEVSWPLTGTATCPERIKALSAYSTQLSIQRKITSEIQLRGAPTRRNRPSGEDGVGNLQAHKMFLTMLRLGEPIDTRRTSTPVVKITLAY